MARVLCITNQRRTSSVGHDARHCQPMCTLLRVMYKSSPKEASGCCGYSKSIRPVQESFLTEPMNKEVDPCLLDGTCRSLIYLYPFRKRNVATPSRRTRPIWRRETACPKSPAECCLIARRPWHDSHGIVAASKDASIPNFLQRTYTALIVAISLLHAACHVISCSCLPAFEPILMKLIQWRN